MEPEPGLDLSGPYARDSDEVRGDPGDIGVAEDYLAMLQQQVNNGILSRTEGIRKVWEHAIKMS